MAPPTKTRKRSLDSPSGSVKRSKGSASDAVSALKLAAGKPSSRAKKPRKRAADYFDDPGTDDDEFVMSKALPVTDGNSDAEAETKPEKTEKTEKSVAEKTVAVKADKKKAKKGKTAVAKEEKEVAQPVVLAEAPSTNTQDAPLKPSLSKKPKKTRQSVTFEEPVADENKAPAKKPAEKSAEKPAEKTASKKNTSKQSKQSEETKPEPQSQPKNKKKATKKADKEEPAENVLDGFSSSDEEGEDEVGIALSQIPKLPKTTELAKLKKKGQAKEPTETPGTVCVSSIPHGFYEPQMKAYFSQFGDINQLRLSRNKKTGHSKHYAFIEFASADVAEIVAKSMDNYLLFNHRLRVQLKAPESLHKDLWKGANKRFKVVPRAHINKKRLDAAASPDTWAKRVKNEKRRRSKKLALLEKIGYKLEMSTEIKAVPEPAAPAALTA